MPKSKCKIGIIGLGRFGTLVSCILSKHAEVRIYHYKDNKEIRSRAKKVGAKLVDLETASKSDVVILAIPISKTEEMIKKISRLAQKNTLIIDTCSVKVLPCQWLKKHVKAPMQIMGTHPMFGPVTTKFNLEKKYWELEKKQIILCPLRIQKEKLEAIKRFLKSLGLEVLVTTPEDHDKQNAKTLSFVHFLGRALNKAEIKKQKIYTPGYTDLLKISPHTNSDNWQLFYDMHNFNPYSEKVRKKFFESANWLEERIIKSESLDDFEFSRKMIDRVDKEIIKLLEERFKYVKSIGKIKKKKGLATVDKKREEKIIKEKIKQSGLDKKFIEDLYKLIFRESHKKQK